MSPWSIVFHFSLQRRDWLPRLVACTSQTPRYCSIRRSPEIIWWVVLEAMTLCDLHQTPDVYQKSLRHRGEVGGKKWKWRPHKWIKQEEVSVREACVWPEEVVTRASEEEIITMLTFSWIIKQAVPILARLKCCIFIRGSEAPWKCARLLCFFFFFWQLYYCW